MLPRLQLSLRTRSLAAAAALAALATFAGGPAAGAPAAAQPTRFHQVNLVSGPDAGGPGLVDPNLVNAWGLALGPTSPLWVANQGSSTATVYRGGVDGAAASLALTVAIPSFGPTGQVFHDAAGDPTGFQVTGPSGTGASAFLFDTLAGDIVGWSPAADRANGVVAAHVAGAVYTGLAMWQTEFGSFLLATDFAGGRIDVFDSSFRRLPPGFFIDRSVPPGFAPFNVVASGDSVYVAYAKQDPNGGPAVAGRGLGIVDRYTNFGATVRRVATGGTLNAPWGMAIAPASFGTFAGALLVGNFGDGLLGAYGGSRFMGLLRDSGNVPIQIEKLWSLLPGTATSGGVNNIWFSSGPQSETHGLVGLISPATT
ncbi:MAG TPA: TIGR03118 family protein [Rugosimonospora sp.]|nr:TIGR03118 family protein [Rugosimonospora sp.]